MPRIYDRECNRCGKHYRKSAKYFCSHKCSNKEKNKGVVRSEKFKERMRNRIVSKETREKIRRVRLGTKMSIESSIKKSESMKGSKNHQWRGGRVVLNKIIRRSFKYRQWISDVFTRDNWTCQRCGIRGGNIHAHHIDPFSFILIRNKIKTFEDAVNCHELWNINNGLTLCKKCHKKTKTFGSKINKVII